MMRKKHRAFFLGSFIFFMSSLMLSLLLLNTAACKVEEEEEEEDISEPVTFEISPVEISQINRVTPLGNLNPPGHTFPTDHIYFYLLGTSLVPVRAVAIGTISNVRFNSSSNDYRIEFFHSSTVSSYLDHVKNPSSGISVGLRVNAGDPVGYSDPRVSALDLGVVDLDITRSFIVSGRYHDFSLHCGDPYTYFLDSVRSQLLAKNSRTADPRGGKIDFDIDGRIVGNWFLQGIPTNTDAAGYDYRYGHLAFVYDMYTISQIRLSTGGTLSLSPFNFAVLGNTPDPATVGVSSGKVKYELITSPAAVLMVEMIASRTIRVEVFPNHHRSDSLAFTAAARLYYR